MTCGVEQHRNGAVAVAIRRGDQEIGDDQLAHEARFKERRSCREVVEVWMGDDERVHVSDARLTKCREDNRSGDARGGARSRIDHDGGVLASNEKRRAVANGEHGDLERWTGRIKKPLADAGGSDRHEPDEEKEPACETGVAALPDTTPPDRGDRGSQTPRPRRREAGEKRGGARAHLGDRDQRGTEPGGDARGRDGDEWRKKSQGGRRIPGDENETPKWNGDDRKRHSQWSDATEVPDRDRRRHQPDRDGRRDDRTKTGSEHRGHAIGNGR
jgi:hypothetical protein